MKARAPAALPERRIFETDGFAMNPSSIHIIGAGRGGTSLLASLIDAHPRCEILFEKLSVAYLEAEGERDIDSGLSLAARTRNRVDRFLHAWEFDAMQHPGMLWGHKSTTEHILSLTENPPADLGDEPGFDPIDYFVGRMSEIPTVFILRDGRTCIPSKMQRNARTLDAAIVRWKFSVEFLMRLRASDTPLHVVRMEDLVLNPVPAVKEICAFIGLPYTAEMLEGTTNHKMLPEYRHGRFDPDTVRLPESSPEWVSRIEPELAYCGYLDAD